MSDSPVVGDVVFVYSTPGPGAKPAVVKTVGLRCLVVYMDGTADHVPVETIVATANTKDITYEY